MCANAGAAVQVVVYLVGGNVDAAADEDFLLAAVDLHAALLILNAQVAREEPAVFAKFLGGSLGVLQIAAEHVGSARNLFTLGAVGNFVAVVVHNLNLNALEGDARPVAVPLKALRRGNRQVWTAFGRTVAFAQLKAVLVGAVHHMARHRSAAAHIELQRAEGKVFLITAVQQVEDERGGAHRPGNAFVVHNVDSFASLEFLLQNHAAAQQKRGDKAVVEAGCVVERRRHEHNVFLRKAKALAEGGFAEDERVVRKEHGLGAAGGAGSGKNECHLIGLASRCLGVGLVLFEDFVQRDGAVRFNRFVVNADGILRKGRNALGNGKDLVFEVGFVMEGGAHERLGFHQVHGVNQIFAIEGNGEWMANGANLQACHIQDAELCPRRALVGNHIAVLNALFVQPCCQAGSFVVDFAIGKANAQVVGYVFALGEACSLLRPNVVQSALGPVALRVVFLLVLLVNFEIGNHESSFRRAGPLGLKEAHSYICMAVPNHARGAVVNTL